MLAEENIKFLQDHGWRYELQPEGELINLIIFGYELPPGYTVTQSDLLIRLPGWTRRPSSPTTRNRPAQTNVKSMWVVAGSGGRAIWATASGVRVSTTYGPTCASYARTLRRSCR